MHHRSLLLVLLFVVGCLPAPRPTPVPRDASEGAYWSGWRDARREAPPTQLLTTLNIAALPLGWLALRRIEPLWVGPALSSSVNVGTTILTHRRRNSPLPEPSGALRAPYALAADAHAERYRDGFQDYHAWRREQDWKSSSRTLGVSLGVVAALILFSR